ncbi:hypothetical protein [Terrimonas pollutisoli]|uniref:hypothetical protein n=1 Tax=Terrimonas pollutisoli TaxID=3034147 RepID=UPI0023EC0C29|nr:hypothetical protein [Terrimonas sp. H1YJ31]
MENSTQIHEVADRLVKSFLPEAVSNQNFFINDIPTTLQFREESPVAVSVLGGLLSAIATCAKNSCIRLTAKLYGNIVFIHVKNSNGFNSHIIQGRLQQLQVLAGKTKGAVGFTSHQNAVTSVTFGFCQ